eukprot:scaffold12998_cov113-Isochrysis_galbana.AAC.2
MALPKGALIAGGAAAIIVLILVLNMGGGRSKASTMSWSPLPAAPPTSDLLAEMKALQQRVAELEQRLGAKYDRAGRRAERLIAAEEARARVHEESRRAAVLNAPTGGGLLSSGSSEADPGWVVVSSTPAAGPILVARTGAEATPAVAAVSYAHEGPLPAPRPGLVPNASWWSDLQVELPGGLWCPKPPPYAAAKPPLPELKPPADKPKLTRELARKHASPDNMLIATYVNYNRLDFAFTLVKHLVALGQPHYLVGALDDEAGRGLQARGIPTFFMGSGLTTNDYGWGTQNFRQLGLHKVNLVLELAKTGVDCLTVDADAFLLRDPFPYFRNLPTADVLVSSDHLVATNGYSDEGLESNTGFFSAFNIGYIFLRASSLEFVQEWRDTCFKRVNDWDQVLFGSVLKKGMLHGGPDEGGSRLKKLYRTKSGSHLMVGVLPVSLFASGHTHFVSRMAHLMHTTPYMVHTTFQYGGAQGKRHRLREAMMWEDEPGYYAEANFLAYDLDLPWDLVYPNGGDVQADGTVAFEKRTSVEQHFALVHYQLVQLRNALAVAQKLRRFLILPRLVCGLDRWWAPHSGIIPGSAARLPLLDCPADHVIDVERMGKPELVLREHSFLCNPRTPAAVRQSVKHISVIPVGAGDPAAAQAGAELMERLSGEQAKVLHLSSLPDYRAVLSPTEAKAFVDRSKGWAGLWCCNRPPGGRGAGHIWYDLFSDVVPHVDRHNRKWEGPWYPKMGP